MQNYLNFLTETPDSNMVLAGNYSPFLVGISVLTAIFSSYAALRVAEQIKLVENRSWQLTWLALGALALGTGVWAMHFIGMLAFYLPCHVNYDLGITLFSILPSIMASAIALYLCSRPQISFFQIIFGGIAVGCGIATMHYVGMTAMQMNARLFYEPKLFVLSVIVAIGFGIVALWIKFGLEQFKNSRIWKNFLSASVMGFAISVMHYTAMAAANFIQAPGLLIAENGLSTDFIVIIIVSTTALVTMLVIVATFAHQHYVMTMALAHSRQLVDNEKLFLESVLEAISEPIFVKNRQHQFIMTNEACCKFLQRFRTNTLDKTDQHLFQQNRADHYYQIDEEVFTTGLPHVNEEEILAADGSIRHIQTKITPYFSAIGEPLLVGVIRDITQEKETLKALEQARTAAEESARMKSMFLAHMSHEIRTPMNAIIGLLCLALNKPLTPDIRDYLEKIKNASDSLLAILNDILDYSKLETGCMQIDPQLFSLEVMLQNLKNLFMVCTQDKSLNLSIHCSSLVPKLLIGDSLRIQQILANLLSNAVKFTPCGTVSLTIELIKQENEQVTLLFKVSDTGIGMSEADCNKLFQAFTQLDNSITRRFGGTGLGLIISNNLLRLMNSQFEVKSELNKGSVFSFTLTLGIANAQEQSAFEQHSLGGGQIQQTLQPNQFLSKLSVLVVEDNLLNQQVVCELLQQVGVKTETAQNGVEALKQLEKSSFDVILMDVHMPVMGGEEAARLIRAQTKFKTLPIIALSAGVTEEEWNRCLDAGMNDFIGKPIEFDKLVKLLTTWMPSKPTTEVKMTEIKPAGDNNACRLDGFDLGNLQIAFNNDWKRIDNLLLKFKETLSNNLVLVEQQLAARDYTQARVTVHSIKGVSANMGANFLAGAAAQLESECKSENINPSSLGNFRVEIARVMGSLATLSS